MPEFKHDIGDYITNESKLDATHDINSIVHDFTHNNDSTLLDSEGTVYPVYNSFTAGGYVLVTDNLQIYTYGRDIDKTN